MVEHIKRYRRQFFRGICSGLSVTERRRLIESHRHIYETYRGILAQKKGSGT
jgi:hypothetical protein